MENATLSESPPEDEVKWQVALFALMPLVLGAMSQPVGRVLDKPANYRLWMRSSPILCIADILHFIIGFTDRYMREPNAKLQFQEELRFRFQDEDLSQTLKDVERTVLVRWILMILGGIPCQTIKLIAMKGIPLTQAIAIIFFIAIVYGEAVIISASVLLIPCRQGGGNNTLNPNIINPPQDMTQKRHPQVRALLKTMRTWMEAAHHSLASYTTFRLLRQGLSSGSKVNFHMVVLPPYYVVVLIFVIAANIRPTYHSDLVSRIKRVVLLHMHDTWDGMTLGVWIERKPQSGHPPFFGPELFVIFIGTLIFTAQPYSVVFSSILRLVAAAICSMHGTTIGRVLGISDDEEEHARLAGFLWTTLLCVLYYAYLFDETGTVNPSWTGVFG